MYRKFVETLRSIGPFRYAPAKTRIGFQGRMIFAAINRMGADYIDGHLILPKRTESKKFYRIELQQIHHFRISRLDEIDRELKRLMSQAYAVGQQKPRSARARRAKPG